jgi:hypothetical protein
MDGRRPRRLRWGYTDNIHGQIDLANIANLSNSQLADIDHVGIVDHVSGGRVYTIERNSSNMVKANDYSTAYSAIVGYISPVGADTPPPPPQSAVAPSATMAFNNVAYIVAAGTDGKVRVWTGALGAFTWGFTTFNETTVIGY